MRRTIINALTEPPRDDGATLEGALQNAGVKSPSAGAAVGPRLSLPTNAQTGATSGNLQDADTVMIVGNVLIRTDQISNGDSLRTDIAMFGKTLPASKSLRY